MFKEYDEQESFYEAKHIAELLNIQHKENAEIAAFLKVDGNIVPNYKKNWDSLINVISYINEKACVEIGDNYCAIRSKRDGDIIIETDLEDYSSTFEMVFYAILSYAKKKNIEIHLASEKSKVSVQVLAKKVKPEESGLYVCYQRLLAYYNTIDDTWTHVVDGEYKDIEIHSWEA